MGGGAQQITLVHRGSRKFPYASVRMVYDSGAHVLWPWLWSSLLGFGAAEF